MLCTKFPFQSAPILSIMVSDRAWSQAVLTAKSAASLQCFLLTKPRRKSICGARIHAFMEYSHEHSLTPSRWSKLRCTRAHTHTQARTRTHMQDSALSLIKPGHLLESPVTTDGCCVSRPAPGEPEIPQCDPTAY